jgi:putative exporter of polyketide antibiotics
VTVEFRGDAGPGGRGAVADAAAWEPFVQDRHLRGVTVGPQGDGVLPRFTGAAWGAVGLFLLLGQLGPVLNLSQWVMDVSPFTHVPKVPGGAVSATPLIWLAVTAAALAAMGLAAFRRRDLSL